MSDATLDTRTEVRPILDTLARIKYLWKNSVVLERVFLFVALWGGLLLVCVGACALVQVPALVRQVMLLALGAGFVAGLVWLVFRPLFREWTDEEVARHIERTYPELNNSLINSVLLVRDRDVDSPELVACAVAENARAIRQRDFTGAVDRSKLKRNLVASIVVAALFGAFLGLAGPQFTGALGRLLFPGQVFAFRGEVSIEVTPGNTRALLNQDVTIGVQVKDSTSRELKATLHVLYPDGKTTQYPMDRETEASFVYRFENRRGMSCDYYVTVGSSWLSARHSRSDNYHIDVVRPVTCKRVDAEIDFPDYTGLETKTVKGVPKALTVPVGSQVTLRFHLSDAIRLGTLMVSDRPDIRMEEAGDDHVLSTTLVADKNRTYALLVEDTHGFSSSSPLVDNQILVDPDKAPTVKITKPAESTLKLAVGGTLEVVAVAEDDYGIKSMEILLGDTDTPEPVVLYTEPIDTVQTKKTLITKVHFPADRYAAGQVVPIHARARDDRWLFLGGSHKQHDPQVVTSPVLRVSLIDPNEQKRQSLANLEAWRKKLTEILKVQRQAREETDKLRLPLDDPKQAAPLMTRQTLVYTMTGDVVEQMTDTTGMVGKIRTILVTLRKSHMTNALTVARDVTEATEGDTARKKQKLLVVFQDEIIKILEELLSSVIPEAKEKIKADKDGLAEDPDLPPEVRLELSKIAKDLERFKDEQKKVLAATLDLTKTPVDNFTEEDKAKLEDLKAIEDKWSKFMEEKFRDLSKLPGQDFANSSMSKELMEIKNDIDKAADALTRKAVELAVPAEQAGLENAEEITTNLEKWLPDAADRLQWKMEEPLGQDTDTEMPELPEQLEDLIGELMEEEENLFEDAEDASSKWTDSLDKGAGWGAMDGPISNNSAKGVTGNQLPNSSEIAGRSGEGRSGKSQGEFVEKEATGKGGRRTPTGLTPDPFEKGEVKDTSSDPAGGATGGGKISGSGGEGLEGPVPPPLSREMKRLAGKQASLINKAEKIAAEFRVRNYSTADLEKLIKEMRQVERDLNSDDRRRYENALRKRNLLLAAMREQEKNLRGEITVQGHNAPLPGKRNRDDLHDVRSDEFPPEYEDLLKQYYKVINEQANRAE